MLCAKVVFPLLFLSNSLLIKSLCDSCLEKEGNLHCDSLNDFIGYENPESVENATMKSRILIRNSFNCEDPAFANYKSLQRLEISNSGIFHINKDCFRGLDSITEVDLNANIIPAVKMKIFESLAKIEVIKLNDNHITNLNFDNTTLHKVVYVKVLNNQIETVDIWKNALPRIKVLHLANNLLERIIINSESLLYLNLSNNRIDFLAPTDLNTPRLSTLDLSYNSLTSVVPILHLPKVSQIYLSHNLIQKIVLPPKGLRYLHIDLSYNKFNSFEEIVFLDHLFNYSLILSHNQIFRLDRVKENFIENREFHCVSCSIHLINPYLFGRNFPNLKLLNLRLNYLTKADIFQGKNEINFKLTNIDLSYNKIQKIQKLDFQKLENATDLSLGNNDISEIELGAFDNLKHLHLLSLTNNFIFILSPNLFLHTSRLSVLDMSGNNMAFLPITENDRILSNLRFLKMNRNPLQCACLEIMRSWAKTKIISFVVDDKNVRNGLKPSCIVNGDKCKTDVDMDFVKPYWHLFNDEKLKQILIMFNNTK
ncbi:hypothetical protein DMENIID0001_090600 [Sergentomyia squamirostris]